MKSKFVIASGLFCSLLTAPGPSRAMSFRVPEDYPTIQSAVDLAQAGDSVLVGPGTWTGEDRDLQICTNFLTRHSVVFMKPGVTVIGVAGPEETILEGGAAVEAAVETVLLANVSGPPAEIRGFTITGGGDGVVIACTDVHLTVSECRITDNRNKAVDFATASVTVRDCVVSGNGFGDPTYGAIKGLVGGELEVLDSEFVANARDAVFVLDSSRILIERSSFSDHVVSGAVSIGSCGDVTIRDSVFLRNATEGSAGGAVSLGSSIATVERCTFASDSAAVLGGGISTVSCQLTAVENTFYGCHAIAGSAVSLGSSTGLVRNNIASAGTGGSALHQTTSSEVLPGSGCNVLWENTEDYLGWPAGAASTDIYSDPEFCAPEVWDFTLESSSPALPVHSGACGQIGALGAGCGAVGVRSNTWGQIKGMFREANRRSDR